MHLMAVAALTETTQTKGGRLTAAGRIHASPLSVKAKEHVVVPSQKTPARHDAEVCATVRALPLAHVWSAQKLC